MIMTIKKNKKIKGKVLMIMMCSSPFGRVRETRSLLFYMLKITYRLQPDEMSASRKSSHIGSKIFLDSKMT